MKKLIEGLSMETMRAKDDNMHTYLKRFIGRLVFFAGGDSTILFGMSGRNKFL